MKQYEKPMTKSKVPEAGSREGLYIQQVVNA